MTIKKTKKKLKNLVNMYFEFEIRILASFKFEWYLIEKILKEKQLISIQTL